MPDNPSVLEQTSSNLSFLCGGGADLRAIGDRNSPFVVTMDEKFLMRAGWPPFIV